LDGGYYTLNNLMWVVKDSTSKQTQRQAVIYIWSYCCCHQLVFRDGAGLKKSQALGWHGT